MRRNQIISDLFNRLHFMDRRGSGINRIINAYADCKEKPKFFSEASHFLVTLPNKSAVSEPKSAVSESRSAVSESKSAVSESKSAVSESETKFTKEEEQQEFKLRVGTQLYGTAWYKTQEKINQMFKRYGYEYSFNSKKICECFNVKERRASQIIQLFIEKGLIFKQKTGEYYFKKP